MQPARLTYGGSETAPADAPAIFIRLASPITVVAADKRPEECECFACAFS
jgi:hypothetical protein